jgi:D-tyrosyl-tRNA(Tyr) deacylase
VRVVVQRVSGARVRPGGAIGPGLVVLLGIARGDEEEAAARLAGRVARLRIFAGEDGRFGRSLLDSGGEALVVPQFTLITAGRARGTRPDFSAAAPPGQAEPLYERFVAALRALGVPTETGVFGARMALELVNDGPVTVVLDV